MRRLIAFLPQGTLLVGSGIGLLGLAAYVQLAVAGHALAESDMASLAVLWSIVFAVAPGIFLPLEQELTRLVADRRAVGSPIRPVLNKGAVLVAGAMALLTAGAWAAQGPIAAVFFQGDRSLVWITCLSLGVHAALHATRGALAGLGRFGWYGSQLAIDGGLRLIGTLIVSSSESVAPYAWLLVIAPALSMLLTLGPVLRAGTPGARLPWAALSGRLGLLTTGAFLNQLMINMAVINAHLLSPDDTRVAVALLAAMVMVRAPVFLFGAMHASLLAGAAAAVARRDWDGVWAMVRRAIMAVSALVAGAAVVLVPAGPAMAAWLFNAPEVLGGFDFVLLSAGVGAYLWAFVFSQVLVAMHGHVAQAYCWLAGTAVLFAVCALPLAVSLRVELGFVSGAATTAVLLGMTLRRRTQTNQRLAVLIPEVARR